MVCQAVVSDRQEGGREEEDRLLLGASNREAGGRTDRRIDRRLVGMRRIVFCLVLQTDRLADGQTDGQIDG